MQSHTHIYQVHKTSFVVNFGVNNCLPLTWCYQNYIWCDVLAIKKRNKNEQQSLPVMTVMIWQSCIVRKGVPAPLFKAPTPSPSLPPLFKMFVFPPSFLFHPFLRYFRQLSPPLCKQPLSRGLSKQFWCPLDVTKSSIFWLRVKTQSS